MNVIKKSVVLFSSVLLGSTLLVGCESMQKEQKGTLVGGATGALIGAQFGGGSGKIWTTAMGAIIGGAVGNHVGRHMDQRDHQYASQAFRKASYAKMGEARHWKNPHSGHSGYVRPVREGVTRAGHYCREFQSEVNAGGHHDMIYGVACQAPDGSWHYMKPVDMNM